MRYCNNQNYLSLNVVKIMEAPNNGKFELDVSRHNTDLVLQKCCFFSDKINWKRDELEATWHAIIHIDFLSMLFCQA